MICDDGGVSASVRRLLLALALACSGLVLTQVPAANAVCRCTPVTNVRIEARAADVVFSGVLVDQRSTRIRTTYSLEVKRIYQGRVADSRVEVVSDARRSRCGLGDLRLDRPYVVFATGASRLQSKLCSGTSRATPAYVADVERVLGPGTAIPKPPPPGQDPPKPEYTRVGDADPPEFTRLAAPGGAMVLLGLLGLILFRKRS